MVNSGIVGLLLVGLAPGLWAQSLGDAAAREKKRREAIDKDKKEKDAPKVFTDDDLARYSGGPPLDGAGRPGAQASPAALEPPESEDWAAPRRQLAETLKPALKQCEADLAGAKQRLTAAEAHFAFVDRYPYNGFSLDEARWRLDNARKAVQRAREACDAVEEKARRAGVPPGWIR